jgi:hypothetical protein
MILLSTKIFLAYKIVIAEGLLCAPDIVSYILKETTFLLLNFAADAT